MSNIFSFAEARQRSRTLQARFTRVYDGNLWGAEESRSGGGSERGSECVRVAADAIRKCVREHGVTSINDIPCGDFNWMPDVLAETPQVRYIGFDIVKPALAHNKDRFPAYEFRLLDVTSRTPPPADLILCKDLLNHLSDDDVKRAIDNMRRSGSTYLLASNNFGFETETLPASLGGSRFLDITTPPFSFRPPLWTLGGYMSLWRLSEMGECGF